MLYFDTCFLAPLILEESASEAVEEFLAGRKSDAWATSHWTRVEYSSILAREVRMGGLDWRSAKAADARFETLLDEHFSVALPSAEDFDLAKAYLGAAQTGLRGGDALHLAIATGQKATAIYTLDKGLLKAGEILRLPVFKGIA